MPDRIFLRLLDDGRYELVWVYADGSEKVWGQFPRPAVPGETTDPLQQGKEMLASYAGKFRMPVADDNMSAGRTA